MPSERKVIALRLDDTTVAEIEKLATLDLRSVANMADILVRLGLRAHNARLKRQATKERKAWSAIDRAAKERGSYG